MKKKDEGVPTALFHTPQSWDWMVQWIEGHHSDSRPHLTIAACMGYNLGRQHQKEISDDTTKRHPKESRSA